MKSFVAPFMVGSLVMGLMSSSSYAGLGDKLRPYQEKVSEKKDSLKASAKKKKSYIVEKAKKKGEKLVTKFGVDTIVTMVNGKEVETTDSLLIRLDNMVSAEVILKMIKLMQADMKFQLDRARIAFDQAEPLLKNALEEVQQKMEDLRQKVSQKIQERIDIYNAEIKGRQEIVDNAKKTLEADNTPLIEAANTLAALTGNSVIGAIREVVVSTAAAKKGMAQKDIIKLNSQIEKTGRKLGEETEKLKKALNDPKYKAQMQALTAQSNAVIQALATLKKRYEDVINADFFNYFDNQQEKYDTGLDTFTQQAGCEVKLTTYDETSIQGSLEKLRSCKKNLLEGITGKPDVPYLRKDTAFTSNSACAALNENSDIADAEKCISAFTGVPLTSFGQGHVNQS